MWCFISRHGQEYVFETKKEAVTFIREAALKNIERYPDEPEEWLPYEDVLEDSLFELKVVSVEEALENW